MKKLLEIIQIAEADSCSVLEMDLKMERNLLKKYHKSIKVLKERLTQNQKKLMQVSQILNSMYASQAKSQKKMSEIDYYIFNGIKVFGKSCQLFSKGTSYYANLLNRCIKLDQRITECLNEQKKKFNKQSEIHENNVREYAEECFPDTSSLFFKLGFMSSEKIVKKPDSFREQTIIQKSKQYEDFLIQNIQELEYLQSVSLQIGQEYYEGGKALWVQSMQEALKSISEYETNEEEIMRIAQETRGPMSDRSNRSIEKKPAKE